MAHDERENSARQLLRIDSDEGASSGDERTDAVQALSDARTNAQASSAAAAARASPSSVDAIDLTDDTTPELMVSSSDGSASAAAGFSAARLAKQALKKARRREKREAKKEQQTAATATGGADGARSAKRKREDASPSPSPSPSPRVADTIDLAGDSDAEMDNASVHMPAQPPRAQSDGSAQPHLNKKQRRMAARASPPPPPTVSSTAADSAVATPAAASVSAAPMDSSDDVDLVALGRELGKDLLPAAAPVTPAPRLTRPSLADEMMAGEAPDDVSQGGGKGKGSERKAARRYFDGEDISTKCYNCGQVGHQSDSCTNAHVFKPCWLCGLRGHAAHRCTRELCFRCQKEGHQSRDCKNPRVQVKCCFWCGSTQHMHTECKSKESVDLSDVRCYVCGQRGHLNCASAAASSLSAAVPGSISALTHSSCSNCGLQGHSSGDCSEDRMELHVNVDNYGNQHGQGLGGSGSGARGGSKPGTPRRDWRSEAECFYCGQKGHLKMDCPKKKSDHEKFLHPTQRRHSFHSGSNSGGSGGAGSFNRSATPNFRSSAGGSSAAAPATPFSRDAARERERYKSGDSRSSGGGGGSGRERERDRDRDRDFMRDRSFDRSRDSSSSHGRNNSRSSGGGGSSSRDDERDFKRALDSRRDYDRGSDHHRTHERDWNRGQHNNNNNGGGGGRSGRPHERSSSHQQRDSRSAPPSKHRH